MNRRRRRGFMTVAALFLVGMVATALALVATGAAADLRRTRSVVAAAQLRQLLLAGGADVAARSRGWGDTTEADSWSMIVPGGPAGYAVRVRVVTVARETAYATVTAEGGGRRVTQRLTWTRQAGRWNLADVETDGG